MAGIMTCQIYPSALILGLWLCPVVSIDFLVCCVHPLALSGEQRVRAEAELWWSLV